MGKWTATVEATATQLRIMSAEDVGEVLSSVGAWAPGASATNNSSKELNALVQLGKLEKGRGYFRTPGCRSEFGDHARLLTKSLVKILVAFPHRAFVLREVVVSALGLRADAIAFLVKQDTGFVFVMEEINSESEESYRRKRELWMNWPGALEYLSGLFGYQVRSFAVINSGELEGLLEAAK